MKLDDEKNSNSTTLNSGSFTFFRLHLKTLNSLLEDRKCCCFTIFFLLNSIVMQIERWDVNINVANLK